MSVFISGCPRSECGILGVIYFSVSWLVCLIVLRCASVKVSVMLHSFPCFPAVPNTFLPSFTPSRLYFMHPEFPYFLLTHHSLITPLPPPAPLFPCSTHTFMLPRTFPAFLITLIYLCFTRQLRTLQHTFLPQCFYHLVLVQ